MNEDNVHKTNEDRMRAADDVVTGMRVQGAGVAQAATKWIFDGKTPRKVSIEELIELFATRLEEENGIFRVANKTHQVEVKGDGDIRDARDADAAALRANVLASGQAIGGTFGAPARRSLGLDVDWAARPDLLLSQARSAVELMRQSKTLKPTAAGVKVDLRTLAKSIEVDCDKLQASLAAVNREERLAQETYQERELRAQEWERAYPGVAEVFTGLCILAGRDELAARVKPTVRKQRRGIKAEDATTSSGALPAPTTSTGTVPAPVTSTGTVAAPALGAHDKSDVAAE